MTHSSPTSPGLVDQAYFTLRHGGAPPARACVELGLTSSRARRLEAQFAIRRPGERSDAMRPRFANHRAHVAAVLAAGGYPGLAR